MKHEYIDDWCYKQLDEIKPCTAPIVFGVPLCHHIQPENGYRFVY